MELYNTLKNKYDLKFSDIISLMYEFESEIEGLEEDLDKMNKYLEDKEIDIIEKDAEIEYLKCLLNDNNIDY